MKYSMNLEQLKTIAASGDYDIIPFAMELFADQKTPMQVLQILKNNSNHVYMLESAERKEHWGRYTFLGYNPTLEITCNHHKLVVRNQDQILMEKEVSHPREEIRNILDKYKSPKVEGLPSFTGGLVGFFSYDYIQYGEPTLKLKSEKHSEFKDMDLMLFDKVIAFDHYKQKILLIDHIKTEELESSYAEAKSELEEMAQLILQGKEKKREPIKLLTEFKNLYSKEQYCQMVERAKEYIREGDIFQVVLSNPLMAKMKGSLLDAYRVMRTSNPSPYMFYFSSDNIEVAGASPETLVKLEGETLHTFPLAGTRKRGETKEADDRLEEELLNDEKERAEHNMLVDLGRNDLGKVSQIGSVEVEKYMTIERFSHVMHIGSTVKGKIAKEKDALDAIDSILPAGTLSGAPKLRACEIIHELEGDRRGIYGGAIGYIDFTGNMDVCIAIRLAYAQNGNLCIRSGAGIVADSIPENEFEECINKAKAVVNAVKTAEEGEGL